MIREQAIVVGVNGNHIEIEVQRQSSCSGCTLSKSCGVGALGRLLGLRTKPVVINCELNLKPGDHILLGMPDKGFLRASLLVYGLPLLMLFVTAITAQLLTNGSEIAVPVSAGTGFFGGIFLSAILVKKRYAAQLNPRVLQINNEPINRF
ncbi:MAG: SoxR reducing system RseC family protein [Gammaproteobacteria bacterium]|nr:SoxR reducing system RseC family protein [Gammaproteobacteria bacterium]